MIVTVEQKLETGDCDGDDGVVVVFDGGCDEVTGVVVVFEDRRGVWISSVSALFSFALTKEFETSSGSALPSTELINDVKMSEASALFESLPLIVKVVDCVVVLTETDVDTMVTVC